MEHWFTVSDMKYTGLNPLTFGYGDCEKGHFWGPGIRTNWLIHFVVSGFGIFRIDGKEYKVRPGEMFIIPPYVENYYEADKINPWNYIWIGFTSDSHLPETLPHIIKLPEAAEIFDAMKECKNFSEGRSAYLSSRLWDLFALILGKEKSNNSYVREACDCIHSEYMNGITIEKIVNRLNIDRTYFFKLFKKEMGMPPKQYLLNYRMNMAATLLKDQNVSVTVAGYSVGYTDIFAFSKMFKSHFGISPKQYAKK